MSPLYAYMAWTETLVRGEILAAMLLITFKAQFGLNMRL